MTVSAGQLVTTGLRAWLGPASSIGRYRHRVWLRYVDLNRHMNQAAYAEVMELARWDWIVRSGMLAALFRARVNPVVAAQQIVYRRELKPLQRFVIDTRAVGFDRRVLKVEHHFLVGDRVHAKGTVDLIPLAGGKVVSPERSRELLTFLVEAPLGVEDWRVVAEAG